MPQDYLSSPALRLLGRYSTAGVDLGSPDDLATLDTSNLPERALAWGGDTLFSLDRESSATPVSFSNGDGLVVAPQSGPGNWIAIAGRGYERLAIEVTAGNFVTAVTVTAANTWSALADHSWVSTALDPVWSISATGVVTYNGPPIPFNVDFTGTFSNAIGANDNVISVYPSLNANLLGTTTNSLNEGRNFAAAQNETQLSYIEQTQLNTGDTFQTLFRSVNGDNYTLVRAKLRLTPISPRLT